MNGVLILDKPAGLTSHDAVNRVRRILGQRAVGHLGTLDPLATGVLPMVVGNYTRLAQFYTSSEKSYEGVIRFGFATDTYDAEGSPMSIAEPVTLDAGKIVDIAKEFVGFIEQIPPPFSAKKINGVPAYKLARRQKEVVLKPVQIQIKSFEIVEVTSDRVRFRAHVASGTYIRSIAHEMGATIGCGAHLESLRRTSVAEFTFDQTKTLDQLAEQRNQRENGEVPCEKCEPGTEGSPFIHPRLLLPKMPSVTADEATVVKIRHGRSVNLPDLSQAPQVKVFGGQSDLIAIAGRIAGTLFHPKIVLAAEAVASSSAG